MHAWIVSQWEKANVAFQQYRQTVIKERAMLLALPGLRTRAGMTTDEVIAALDAVVLHIPGCLYFQSERGVLEKLGGEAEPFRWRRSDYRSR